MRGVRARGRIRAGACPDAAPAAVRERRASGSSACAASRRTWDRGEICTGDRRADAGARGGSRSPARRARGRRLGLLQPADRYRGRCRRDPGSPPAADRLAGRGAERRDGRDRAAAPLGRRRWSKRRCEAGLAAGWPPRDPRHRRPCRIDRRPAGEGGADGAAPARPLSGPDEHLRRPRQHRLPAAALRVARDRVLLRGRRARASGSTPAPTTSSTSAAGRIATSGWSPPTWSRASARRSPRRSTTAPWCSPSAAATSCSATATSSARRSCPGSGSPTWRRSASRDRG